MRLVTYNAIYVFDINFFCQINFLKSKNYEKNNTAFYPNFAVFVF